MLLRHQFSETPDSDELRAIVLELTYRSPLQGRGLEGLQEDQRFLRNLIENLGAERDRLAQRLQESGISD